MINAGLSNYKCHIILIMILTPLASFCLNLIRILAAQAVLVGHLILSHKLMLQFSQPNIPYMENIAVVLFFLLSGLLIPMSVAAKRQRGPYRFIDYLRVRFTRIYGVFLPALLLVIILDGLTIWFHPAAYRYYSAFNLKTLVTNLLMLQYYPSVPFGSGRPFWSLPLWWWTYLGFGWLVLGRPRFWTLFLLAIPIYSLFFGRGQGLVLVWLMGAIIYYGLSHKFLAKFKPRFSLALALIMLILAGYRVITTLREYEIIFELLLAGGIGFLINFLQPIKIKINGQLTKTVGFFAGYSLTLYLTHFSINEFILASVGRQSSLLLFVSVWIICNLTAIIIAAFTEKKVR